MTDRAETVFSEDAQDSSSPSPPSPSSDKCSRKLLEHERRDHESQLPGSLRQRTPFRLQHSCTSLFSLPMKTKFRSLKATTCTSSSTSSSLKVAATWSTPSTAPTPTRLPSRSEESFSEGRNPSACRVNRRDKTCRARATPLPSSSSQTSTARSGASTENTTRCPVSPSFSCPGCVLRGLIVLIPHSSQIDVVELRREKRERECVAVNTPLQANTNCPATVYTDSFGVIYSPSSSSPLSSFIHSDFPSDYPNNAFCTYLLGNSLGRISLTFYAIDTEGCCDLIKIYDGSSSNAPLLGT